LIINYCYDYISTKIFIKGYPLILCLTKPDTHKCFIVYMIYLAIIMKIIPEKLDRNTPIIRKQFFHFWNLYSYHLNHFNPHLKSASSDIYSLLLNIRQTNWDFLNNKRKIGFGMATKWTIFNSKREKTQTSFVTAMMQWKLLKTWCIFHSTVAYCMQYLLFLFHHKKTYWEWNSDARNIKIKEGNYR